MHKSPLARYLRNQTPSIGTPAHAHLTAFDARLKAANLPADYRAAELVDADVTVAITKDGKRAVTPRQLRKWANDYAKSFDRQFDGEERGTNTALRVKSLYLWSAEPGTGKTTTAAALTIEYLTQHYIGAIKRGVQPAQRPAYFLDITDYLRLYNQFSRGGGDNEHTERAKRQYYDAMQIALAVPFLTMDDLGVRQYTDKFIDDLHVIINQRTANGMTTIYTSNLAPSELRDRVDFRTADPRGRTINRVTDMCFEVEFAGESKRGIRK